MIRTFWTCGAKERFGSVALPAASTCRSANWNSGSRISPATAKSQSTAPGGYRSAIAAGILQAHGFTQLSDLAGGYNAWLASGCSGEASSERSERPPV